ncbi:hypothetical protein ACH5RR_037496 [Cinchona calisaya]|uniref:DUF4283 domain-containing protein n=1 Tax=Cinchona calisaya TaxID=153742 RepID=A0ABD2Y9F9_9GENT
MFQFIFGLEQDQKRVARGGSWIIDNKVIILQKWREDIEMEDGNFNYTNIWVQVWNLPICWLSKERGRQIGLVFEEVLDVVVTQTGRHSLQRCRFEAILGKGKSESQYGAWLRVNEEKKTGQKGSENKNIAEKVVIEKGKEREVRVKGNK